MCWGGAQRHSHAFTACLARPVGSHGQGHSLPLLMQIPGSQQILGAGQVFVPVPQTLLVPLQVERAQVEKSEQLVPLAL